VVLVGRAPLFVRLLCRVLLWLRLVLPVVEPRPGIRPLVVVCMVEVLLDTIPATELLILKVEANVVRGPPGMCAFTGH
jgi:hypothetical protein